MFLWENKILSVTGGVVQLENESKVLAPRVVELLQTEEALDNADLQDKIRMLVVGEIQQVFLDYSLPYSEIEATNALLAQSLSHNRWQALAGLFGKKYYWDITIRDIDGALKNNS